MRRIALAAALLAFAGTAAAEDEYERDPIAYSRTAPDNAVSRLQGRIDEGNARLDFDARQGYLRSVLRELAVPAESQVLVFSKTSLQRHRISPRSPRAIYFNDDVYVGFCRSGDVLEVSAVDPQLGTVFYTLDQDEADHPRFVRQTDNCLLCHGGSQTNHIPGHLVRSLFSDDTGQPLLASGSVRVDHTTPIEKRWGSWYVTGRHGAMTHLGNLVIHGKHAQEPVDNAQGQNVVDLAGRFETDDYLTPHSDIVALMVLEHQTMAHNLIVRLSFTTRQALHDQEALNRELKQPAGTRWNSTTSRIRGAADALVKCLLFSGEAPIAAPISGTSGFAEQFVKAGPHDSQGRSLRDFDLTRRMFRHPCSYLVHSRAIAELPEEARDAVRQRLFDVLSGKDDSKDFAHLTAEDRKTIRQLLPGNLSMPPE